MRLMKVNYNVFRCTRVCIGRLILNESYNAHDIDLSRY